MTIDVPSETSAWRAVVRVLRSPLSTVRSPLDALGCTLFPASCCLCSNPLLRLTRLPVCEPCWNEVPVQSAELCARCGEDLGVALYSTGDPRPAEQRLCRICRMAPPPFRRAVAHGVYEGRLRALVQQMKYGAMPGLAAPLGRLLARSAASRMDSAPSRMVVVPVPLHGSKRRDRGYNQAALLARSAVRELRRAHREHRGMDLRLAEGLLQRRRATESQAGLTGRERRLNLRGAFFVPEPGRVKGRHVLLIDDIFTTGATARACSQALLEAGAASVWVATLARAQREGVAFWGPRRRAVRTGFKPGVGTELGRGLISN